MAAIDKLYVQSYSDLSELRVWALVYYPKLFLYMYDSALTLSYKDYEKSVTHTAKVNQKIYKTHWESISPDGTINCAIAYYLNAGCSTETAQENAKDSQMLANKTFEEIKSEIRVLVLNTPAKVDKKLKWICPLPCVRLYLQEQCGVKEHWYYKLFWRGRRKFHYYY